MVSACHLLLNSGLQPAIMSKLQALLEPVNTRVVATLGSILLDETMPTIGMILPIIVATLCGHWSLQCENASLEV